MPGGNGTIGADCGYKGSGGAGFVADGGGVGGKNGVSFLKGGGLWDIRWMAGGFGGGGDGQYPSGAGGGGGGYSGGCSGGCISAAGAGSSEGGCGGGSYDINGPNKAATLATLWNQTVYGSPPTSFSSGMNLANSDGFVRISLSSLCALGTISGATACTLCSAGLYQSGTGMTSAGSCVSCGVGTFQPSAGASACVYCVAGTFSTGTGMTTCSQCSAGTYSTALGATAAAACSNCGAGSFQTAAGMAFCSQGSNQPVALDARGDSMGGSAMYNWGRGPDGSRPYSAPSIQPLSHRSQTGHNPV